MKGIIVPDTPPEADLAFAQPASESKIDAAAKALETRNFKVHVVDTVAAARLLIGELLPTEVEIFTASSETLRLSGIADDIDKSGRFHSLRTTRLAQLDPMSIDARRLGASPDVVVGSAHAVTEDGQIVVASASGSQLSAYAAGASEVFLVIGAQKIVSDLNRAFVRIETYSLPLESQRLMALHGQPSVIGKLLVIRREIFPGRTTVIISKEPIGF
ncbi:MAG TPA: LUD domain-containing protein [Acidimicrobiales bacterium]|nr:LUD domain-containing protein [Acidimicrobiales bacterium]